MYNIFRFSLCTLFIYFNYQNQLKKKNIFSIYPLLYMYFFVLFMHLYIFYDLFFFYMIIFFFLHFLDIKDFP